MSPSTFLFSSTLILGTVISISRTNWLYLWIGIELNLLSFIPLIASYQSFQETEARVKYFIIQAIGRGLILTAGIISINPTTTTQFSYFIIFIFLIRIIIKLGIAPCHQWLPHVISRISWIHCIILATWQKIGPFLILIIITPPELFSFCILIAALNAVIGGIGGLNQAQLRALLAYSSIGHIGWILATMGGSITIFILYFLTYVIISIRLITIIFNLNSIHSKSSRTLSCLPLTSFLIVIITIFRLGGLPPFLGFIPKWLIISYLSLQHLFILLTILILGSIINLFYYFNITFNFILSYTQNPSWHSPPLLSIIICSSCSVRRICLII